MIGALILAAAISCNSLVPLELIEDNSGDRSPYLRHVIVELRTGEVLKRWDLTRNGKADVMTSHMINPEKLEAYRQLAQRGIPVNSVESEILPYFYWVDITGQDSWDRIYVDKERDGTCELYARQDHDA